MRLFVAIEFDKAIRTEVAKLTRTLFEHVESGRAADAENLHLTLSFLGELPAGALPLIRQCMENAAGGELELGFTGLGSFNRREGDIWWLGVRLSPELKALEARLGRYLMSAGFKLDDREYKPHITLGRNIKIRSGFDKKTIIIPDLIERVNEIVLMESTRDRNRLLYIPQVRTTL